MFPRSAPLAAALALALAAPLAAQAPAAPAAVATYVPDLATLVRRPASELQDVVERFTSDRFVLLRRWDVPYSPTRRALQRAFYADWLARTDSIAFDSLSEGGRVDWLLLRGRLRHEQSLLTEEDHFIAETAPLVPFANTVFGLAEARRNLVTMDPAATADSLARLAEQRQYTRCIRRSQLRAVLTSPPSPRVHSRALAAQDALDRDAEAGSLAVRTCGMVMLSDCTFGKIML